MPIKGTNKPDALHASKIAKIVSVRGAVMGERLASILAPGVPRDERVRAFCELAAGVTAEFVNLIGEEEWLDIGPDGRDPLLTMLMHGVAARVPDFAERFEAVRAELEEIPREVFEDLDGGMDGLKLCNVLCYEVVPGE